MTFTEVPLLLGTRSIPLAFRQVSGDYDPTSISPGKIGLVKVVMKGERAK